MLAAEAALCTERKCHEAALEERAAWMSTALAASAHSSTSTRPRARSVLIASTSRSTLSSVLNCAGSAGSQ